jgi:hypothetical protein
MSTQDLIREKLDRFARVPLAEYPTPLEYFAAMDTLVAFNGNCEACSAGSITVTFAETP